MNADQEKPTSISFWIRVHPRKSAVEFGAGCFRAFFTFGLGRSCLAERLAAQKLRDSSPFSRLELPALRHHDSRFQRAQNVLRRHLLHGSRLGRAFLLGIVMAPGALLLVDGSAIWRLRCHAQRTEKDYEANRNHAKLV